jgi:antitoxin FitA
VAPASRERAIIAIMSQLVVRNVPPRIVKALKQRAARAGRSAEAEHRVILESALSPERTARDFKAFLRAMPDGRAARFRRSKDGGRAVDL